MASPVPQSPAARRTRFACALFALVLPLLFHTPYWNGESILYSADAAQLQFPRYKILCDTLQQEGALAAWQTWLYTGSPFHANPENPTLYPPVVFFASFCTPGWTINLTILSHLSLAGLGAFVLVRRLWERIDTEGQARGAGLAGALVGAAVFSLSHWTRVDHLNLVAYGAAHALIPWVLFAADSMLSGARPLRAAGLLGLLLGFQVLTGGLYVITYMALVLGAWMLFLGLLGGRTKAVRTVCYGLPALALAALLVAGKALPYLEWIPTTNRAAQLNYAEAVGTTLGTAPDGSWQWIEVWRRVEMYTFFGVSLALALMALPLLRHGVVRLAFGLALLCFAIGLGGELHRLAFDHVPLFDQTRSAVRAWTGVNAMLPLLAGLGFASLCARFAWLRGAEGRAAAAGMLLCALVSPMLAYSFRHQENFRHPQRLSELPRLYHRWPRAAQLCGKEWRAMYVDRGVAHSRNEQFISTLLEVETPAGYLGHVWPRALERHLYGTESAPLSDASRFRRRSTLSVKWMVSTSHGPEAGPPSPGVLPPNVDGTLLVENPIARPRAVEPSVVLGVFGDPDSEVAYTVLDQGTFPLLEAATVQFAPDRPLAEEELAALDGLIVCGAPSPAAAAALAVMGARPALPGRELPRALEVRLPLGAEDRAAVLRLEHELALDALEREPAAVGFERLRSDAARLTRADASRGRWVVVSEPWSVYAGWRTLRAEPVGGELSLERADGVSSAVFLPAGAHSADALYAPRSIRLGLWIHALGVLIGLCLVLWPARGEQGFKTPGSGS
jgi:hypothetical protein